MDCKVLQGRYLICLVYRCVFVVCHVVCAKWLFVDWMRKWGMTYSGFHSWQGAIWPFITDKLLFSFCSNIFSGEKFITFPSSCGAYYFSLVFVWFIFFFLFVLAYTATYCPVFCLEWFCWCQSWLLWWLLWSCCAAVGTRPRGVLSQNPSPIVYNDWSKKLLPWEPSRPNYSSPLTHKWKIGNRGLLSFLCNFKLW